MKSRPKGRRKRSKNSVSDREGKRNGRKGEMAVAAEIRLLVADGDASVRDIIRLGAGEEGWRCEMAPDGIAALKLLKRQTYDLIILDAELPEVEGLIVCRHLRKESAVPVILISRNTKEAERLAGFAAGGNDYVIKPFYPRELMARIRNLLKLCGHAVGSRKPLEAGRIVIDLDSHAVLVDGQTITLAPKEFDLLLFFCRNPGQAFTRDNLLDLVWGDEYDGSDRTVDTHVKALRGRVPPCQRYIQTVWGFGYRFEPGTKSLVDAQGVQ